MTIDPILDAAAIIQTHMALALFALLLGPFVLWRKRRDLMHKTLGYIWVLGMGGAALSGLFIPSHFTSVGVGPIHLLSLYALWGVYVAMRAIYLRDIKTHQLTMQNMYVRGVALAGAFNFLPGRTMAQTLIPEVPAIGFVIIAVVLVWAFLPLVLNRRPDLAKKGSFQA